MKRRHGDFTEVDSWSSGWSRSRWRHSVVEGQATVGDREKSNLLEEACRKYLFYNMFPRNLLLSLESGMKSALINLLSENKLNSMDGM